MQQELEQLESAALDELARVSELSQLEAWRVQYLGKKSALTAVLRSLSSLSSDERKVIGARANSVKESLQNSLATRKETLSLESLDESLGASAIDVTLPGRPLPHGRLHPTTQVMGEICSVFAGMGFQIIEGPEVERDYYNFEALNIPETHPARDMFATLWVDAREDRNARLLRTHTSPMQIRLMEQQKPPLRFVVPGRTYRYEATDATHEWMFHQVEGLAIDVDITLRDLKETLFEFCKKVFGRDTGVRFRCDYFPFVEPGGEVAIECVSCKGAGCRLCGGTGWLEILGCGMVHPDVLSRCGIDPSVHSGFAFGMGVERVSILRHGIDDIRHFYSDDFRFLRQF
ncbi:MAG: phenylalanine--tRNA ligase subunit alpha [Dehalococcoidia bacterium]|nr:phenylalanine--tRNA ligase subunit alpha [Dehalococcoidia bacterium]